MKNSLIASRIFNVPLMVDVGKLDAIASYMQARMLGNQAPEIIGDDEKIIYAGLGNIDSRRQGNDPKQYHYETNMVINDGVAMIGVQGVLVGRKGRMQGISSELTSYHRIRENIESAYDIGVTEVVLDVDSPGGEAIGAKECADFIHSMREHMNITAVISGMCCSAAYFIASAASEIVISPTSFGGHVGVRYRRWDFTKAIEKSDLSYRDFFAGDLKLEGDPSVPMTEAEEKRINEEIAFHYDIFTSSVAEYRGMTQQAVKDTQALTYYGQRAVEIGFADNVMEAHDAVANIYQNINQEENRMKGKQTGAAIAATENNPDNPQAATTDSGNTDVAEVKLEARQEERKRIESIITSEHAEGREKLAAHLAFKTDQSPEDAQALMEASPVESKEPKSKTGALDTLMKGEDSPEVGAGDGNDSEQSTASKSRAGWAEKKFNGGDK